MARLLLFLHHGFGLAALEALAAAGGLAGVVVPDGRRASVVAEARRRAERVGVASWTVGRHDLARTVPDLVRAGGADAGLITAFPWILPEAALAAFPLGVYNAHPGLLPAYRGADPLFWQIRRGEAGGGITLHRLDAGVDTGPIVEVVPAPILPWETHGIHAARLEGLVGPLALRLATALAAGRPPATTPQVATASFPCRRPRADDLAVRWLEDDAASVQRLVNACNGAHDGPRTALGGALWKLDVVTVVPAPDQGIAPGTVVRADVRDGLLVACRGGALLRLDVVTTREGTLTGAHLVALGLSTGARFDALPPAAPSLPDAPAPTGPGARER